MRNLKRLSEKSKTGRVKLFYSPKNKAVYDKPGNGRYFLTELIRENTPEEIEKTVKYFMAM